MSRANVEARQIRVGFWGLLYSLTIIMNPKEYIGHYLGFYSTALPVGSCPTPFLAHLLSYVADPNHKTRYPKEG